MSGNCFPKSGRFEASLYHRKYLTIAKETGDRARECDAHGNPGNAYYTLGNLSKTIEYHEQHLNVAKEVGNRSRERLAYQNLGHAYYHLGGFKQAKEYLEKSLAEDLEGSRAWEGEVCGKLGNAHLSLCVFFK